MVNKTNDLPLYKVIGIFAWKVQYRLIYCLPAEVTEYTRAHKYIYLYMCSPVAHTPED